MRLSLFVLLFLVLEITSIIKVGGLLGASGAIGLLVLGAILGGVIFNLQSQRMRGAMLRGAAGGNPLNSLSLYLAAVLFVFPGFVSDFFALLLLFPPTRLLLLAGAGQYLIRRLGPRLQRMQSFRVYNFGGGNPFEGFGGGAPGSSGTSGPSSSMGRRGGADDDDIIEGEFRDVTDLHERQPGVAALPGETDRFGRSGEQGGPVPPQRGE